MGNALGPELARFRKTNTISRCANDGALAKADCQRLTAESLPKCFGCGYAALCWRAAGSAAVMPSGRSRFTATVRAAEPAMGRGKHCKIRPPDKEDAFPQ